MVTIGINGLGRIGRSVVRALIEQEYKDVTIGAVNDLTPVDSLVHLLKYDSVHGRFPGTVKHEGDEIQIGAHRFPTLQERDPARIGWDRYGVDIVLECTGLFTTRDKAEGHLSGGAKRVLLSAPAKDDTKTVVYGVNHTDITDADRILSNGSCTTNCLAPIAKVMDDSFGLESGFMTTIHSYTNDQNIVDAGHQDLRRARAAAMSMIPTSTGAAKALGLVLPGLAGKLDGVAIRVPTPNVSLVDLSFIAKTALSREAMEAACRQAAAGPMQGVMAINDAPLVSVDYTHDPHSSIADMTSIYVTGERLGRIAAWYDNEWGFSCRLLDVAHYLGAHKLANAA